MFQGRQEYKHCLYSCGQTSQFCSSSENWTAFFFPLPPHFRRFRLCASLAVILTFICTAVCIISPCGINKDAIGFSCSSSPPLVSHVQSQHWRVLPAPLLLPCRSTRRRPFSSSPPAGLSPLPPLLLAPCPPPLPQELGAVKAGSGPTGRMKVRAARASPGTASHITLNFHFMYVLLRCFCVTFFFVSSLT